MKLKLIEETLILVDLKENTRESGLDVFLHQSKVSTIPRDVTIREAIYTCRPKAICFDFGYPELQGLRMLLRTRTESPEIPVLMVTALHSENLAVWALRNRVWDYLVEPLDGQEIISRIKLLSDGNGNEMLPPKTTIPKEVRFYKKRHNKRTSVAINHIYANYSEKIRQSTLAELCDMGPIQFCITFKRENGITFQEFLLKHRIEKASQLLERASIQVTDVAYSVGFNDVSYFSRIFKRHLGVNPSQFQRRGYLESNFKHRMAAEPIAEVFE